MLLLAHALELFVDLLRGLDAVGVVRWGSIGRGGSVGRACVGRGDDGTAQRLGVGLWLRVLGGRHVRLGSVIEGSRIRVGRSGTALTWGENQL